MAGSGYRDYFKVLGVERSADADTVKRAFRKLARQYHPDVNPDDQNAEARFKEVSEAYEVLSDPEKRRRYEQFGQYWNQAGMPGGGSGPAGVDVDFGRYGNFDDFINDLLGRFGGGAGSGPAGYGGGFPGGGFPGGGFPRGGSRAPLNLDAEAAVKVTFSEAFRGGERTLSVNDERVQVRIPPGVKSGSKLRLKGKGLPPLQPRLDPARLEKMRGDLFVRIFVEVPTRLTARQRELLEEFAEESGQNVSPEHKSFVEKLKDFFD